MQLHGGMGYAEEFPVSRFFVDARVLSIFEGADETLCLRVIARRLAEQALCIANRRRRRARAVLRRLSSTPVTVQTGPTPRLSRRCARMPGDVARREPRP